MSQSRLLRGGCALAALGATAFVAGTSTGPSVNPDAVSRAAEWEQSGEVDRAEAALLEQARVERLVRPRWALANFYSRQGRLGEFWKWSRESLRVSRRDMDPVFHLLWRIGGDEAEIRRNGLPPIDSEQRRAWNKYLEFLLHTDRLDAAAPVANELARLAVDDDRPVLLAWCDRAAESGRARAAIPAWNAVGPRHEEGALVNANFASEPIQRGLDWRVTPPEGVSALRTAGIRFVFSGHQPRAGELLWQPLPQGAEVRPLPHAHWEGGAMEFEWVVERGAIRLRYRQPGQGMVTGSYSIERVELTRP